MLFLTIALLNLINQINYKIEPKKIESSVCRLPELKLVGHENRATAKPCSIKENWGYLSNGKWYLNKKIKEQYSNISCKYREIKRKDDFKLIYGNYSQLIDESSVTGEVIDVLCEENNDGRVISKYENVHVQIKNRIGLENIKDMKKNADEPNCKRMNILLFSYDSVSRVSWLLRLKKSSEFMFNVMKFHLMKGFNIIGEGTPACIIPVLTGKTEEELPNVLKSNPNGSYVDDVYPFIWKELHEKGYVSMFNEDAPGIGTFTYRMRGMRTETTTHYLRTYQSRMIEVSKGNPCVGSVTRHQKNLDFINEFYDTYKDLANTFIYSHLSESSHDGNDLLHNLDDELLKFLSDNYFKGTFENTAIFMYSDHGARFRQERAAPQGYLEERLPFFSVFLPENFKNENKEKIKNLLANSDIISSPFDVYATIRELTCMPKSEKVSNNISKRSISFLDKFSENRTCEECGIIKHYCVCVEWLEFDAGNALSTFAASFVVDYINSMVKDYDLCAQLKLDRVLSVGYIMQKNGVYYFLIKLTTSPNNALYEVRLKYDGYLNAKEFKQSQFVVKYNEISRLNKYGAQAACFDDLGSSIDIRKFCLCKTFVSSFINNSIYNSSFFP